MLHTLFVGLLLTAQTPALPARDAQSADWRVIVTAAVYQPDGAVSAETAALANATPGVVHVYGRKSLCDTAAGASEPADAGFGWRLASTVVRASASEVVVSIDWQRMWDRGQRLTAGPSGTVQLTLHPGDRIPLDHIPNPAATETCRAVGMGLEVKLARTTPVELPGTALLPLGAIEGVGATLDADLWLVHMLPAGTQQAHHQKVRLPANGNTFTFAPVTVPTPGGEVQVEITGTLRRYRMAAGGEFLYLSMARQVTGGQTPAGGLTGGTGTVIALPGPGEVLSIEMPSPGGGSASAVGRARAGAGGGGGARGGVVGVQGGTISRSPGTGGAVVARGGRGQAPAPAAPAAVMLAGHEFSLRLRLTPVPGM